jgi:ubiquinone/menaquinone biosynthesis C-methylase UbiE
VSDDRDRVRAYYRSMGESEWGRLERPADGRVEFSVTTDAIARHLAPSSHVLDIGGGPGRYAIWMASLGHRVTLADLSPELIAIADERIADAGLAHAVTTAVADVTDLGRWPDATFDAALCLGPLYYLTEATDRDRAVEELVRVVRPDGVIVAAVMPRMAFLRRTFALPDEWHHLEDPAWVRRLLDQGVFENELPGRFSVGYGFRPEEIEPFFGSHGLHRLGLLAAESASVGVAGPVGDLLRLGGSRADVVMDLMVDLAADPTILGAASHIVHVGRR